MRKGTHSEIEQRQFIRLEKTLPVRFDLPDARTAPRTFEALSRNIGEGGVFVESDIVQDEALALSEEAILNLEIEFLGQAQRIKVRGEVVWISKKSRTPQKRRSGFGVRFIQISADKRKAISLFIYKEMLAQAELVAKDIPVISREQKLTDRQRRNLEILNAIRVNRLISRAEISKHTGINIVTVSNYIDTYLKKGLVFERGLDISTGGRRPELVELNPKYGYVIGADIGPLNARDASMQVVATDFTSRMLGKVKEKRPNDFTEEAVPLLKDLIAKVLESTPVEKEKVKGIGIGISGLMDNFGGSMRNPLTGTTFANYVTIKKDLEDEFALPVFIENNASCALFAEKWTGTSLEVKAADNIIYIASEHQCAIMLKGELYTGVSKSAGQLNLALLEAPKELDFVTERSNIISDYCWMDPSSDCIFHSCLGDLEMLAESKENLSSAGTKLGGKIACLVNMFNPQAVMLDGRFSQLGDIFLDAVRRTVSGFAFREGANIVRIIPATLGEEARALGVASLVIESAFANI